MKALSLQIAKNAFKAAISILFLFILFKRVDFPLFLQILKESSSLSLFLLLPANVLVTALLALRWKVIITPSHQSIGFLRIWKLTLIGLFFNIFLPTGAGGDIAKIYLFTKDQTKKLSLGISVLFDRFIGAVSIILMGGAGFLFFQGALPPKTGLMITLLLIVTGIAWILILWENLTDFFLKLLPEKFSQKILLFFGYLREYGKNRTITRNAISVSILCQSLSILIQFFMLRSFLGIPGVPILFFFIVIPLIWVSTLVPSLGGLGIREFTYSFFFTPFIGEQQAIALSLMNLLLILFQSAMGAGALLLSGKSETKK
ncbi:MAG: lysylphosphatidylglycerol synthase transmembrane domain-containing protein [Candidatus Ratteibacteria bacterium]